MATKKVLRLPAVKATTGLSRSSIYLMVRRGDFPAPISIGSRAIGWIESEVAAWLTARPSARRPGRRPGRAQRPLPQSECNA
ncbi:MAG: AlpA family transcriptional regulator [Candidatus Contendobacter sp.]|nr:AlpA family transcriptional regulator [Candidatus Contendobacter sp.]MDS4031225.1 AlpA family transcriptional regulator [Candidatus Contendobacter sp.]